MELSKPRDFDSEIRKLEDKIRVAQIELEAVIKMRDWFSGRSQ